MPRADDLPSFTLMAIRDPLPGQSARREGLRRGRRDRLDAGGNVINAITRAADRQQQVVWKAAHAGDAE
jgi:hypothetical protein